MKNIVDYIKDSKDKPFSEEPFNEVDGLALAELVYIDFDSILNEESYSDIAEINDIFWANHTEEEILESTSHSKWAPFLMREMADSVRYGGMKFKNYLTDVSLMNIKQFGAVSFELPDGTDYISYRGTNKTVAGWMEDFKFSFSTTDGQDEAVVYINKYYQYNKRPIRVGGHSKGGNLAVYAAVFCDREIQDNIISIYSYDGPGFKMDVLESEDYARILPRVISVIPRDCMVGIMMNNRYKTIVANSDDRSIHQHNAFLWHIEGNRFETLDDRSNLSFFFEKVLNLWMSKCDASKREKILEILFALIMDNGLADSDNTKLDYDFFYTVLQNTPKLSREERIVILSSISDILVSTSVVTSDELKMKSAIIAEDIKEKSTPVAEEIKAKSAPVAEEVKDKYETIAEELKDKYAVVAEEVKTVAGEVKEKYVAVTEDLKDKSANIKEKIASRKKSNSESDEADSETEESDEIESE